MEAIFSSMYKLYHLGTENILLIELCLIIILIIAGLSSSIALRFRFTPLQHSVVLLGSAVTVVPGILSISKYKAHWILGANRILNKTH